MVKKSILRWELGGILFISCPGVAAPLCVRVVGQLGSYRCDCGCERKRVGTPEAGFLAGTGIRGSGIRPLWEVGKQLFLCEDSGNLSNADHDCGPFLFIQSYLGVRSSDCRHYDFCCGRDSRTIGKLQVTGCLSPTKKYQPFRPDRSGGSGRSLRGIHFLSAACAAVQRLSHRRLRHCRIVSGLIPA